MTDHLINKGYCPQDIIKLYYFPDNTGKVHTIAALALGGTFFPNELVIFETNLDIQTIVGMTSNAKILLYYYAYIFHEGFQETLGDTLNKVNIVFTSWAIDEKYFLFCLLCGEPKNI